MHWSSKSYSMYPGGQILMHGMELKGLNWNLLKKKIRSAKNVQITKEITSFGSLEELISFWNLLLSLSTSFLRFFSVFLPGISFNNPVLKTKHSKSDKGRIMEMNFFFACCLALNMRVGCLQVIVCVYNPKPWMKCYCYAFAFFGFMMAFAFLWMLKALALVKWEFFFSGKKKQIFIPSNYSAV